jgi:hypothetical protein
MGDGNTNVTSTTFGKVTGVYNTARQAQRGTKFVFQSQWGGSPDPRGRVPSGRTSRRHARPGPESSELIRQEGFSENFWKPATVFHPGPVTPARAGPNSDLRRRKDWR